MQNIDQQKIRVAIYTPAGWISGMIHVGAGQTLLGEINDGGSFFRLTDVALPMEETTRDFFAIHARESTIVLPLEVADQYGAAGAPNGTIPHEIVCLLQEGTMLCSLDVLEGCRVSDHLLSRDGFIAVREVRAPMMELPPGTVEPIPVAYLNSHRIIGVTETNAMKADAPVEDEAKSIFSEM